MWKYKYIICLFALWLWCIRGYVNAQDATQAYAFPIESVTLKESWIQRREALNIEYLQSLDADRLLHNFRINAGLPSSATPLEGWEAPNIGLRGHFVGHYLSACSFVVNLNSATLL